MVGGRSKYCTGLYPVYGIYIYNICMRGGDDGGGVSHKRFEQSAYVVYTHANEICSPRGGGLRCRSQTVHF